MAQSSATGDLVTAAVVVVGGLVVLNMSGSKSSSSGSPGSITINGQTFTPSNLPTFNAFQQALGDAGYEISGSALDFVHGLWDGLGWSGRAAVIAYIASRNWTSLQKVFASAGSWLKKKPPSGGGSGGGAVTTSKTAPSTSTAPTTSPAVALENRVRALVDAHQSVPTADWTQLFAYIRAGVLPASVILSLGLAGAAAAASFGASDLLALAIL